MATFYDLPYDVVYQIFNILHDTDRRSLRSLSATCRRTRREAIPIMFASISFYEEAAGYYMDDIQIIILALLTNSLLLASIRRFSMRVNNGTHISHLMSSLFHLISSMPGLHELFIDAPKVYASHLRAAVSPLAEGLIHLGDEGVPEQLQAAHLDPKPFDPSSYQLPSVKRLVLDSWEWGFIADYCPNMQSLEVLQDSSIHYINQHSENCFEVDIAHLARTHPNLQRLHLNDTASVEVVSVLAKHMQYVQELGFHSRTTPSTNALTQFTSFGNLYALCLPSVSDLRRVNVWDGVRRACDLCKGKFMSERQEAATEIIGALKAQTASIREVHFGPYTRREVFQRLANEDFGHIKTLSRQYYHASRDTIEPVDPRPTEAPDDKGKGRAHFLESHRSVSPPCIYGSTLERGIYNPCPHSYHRRSRSRSPIIIQPPSHHRRSRSRSPIVIQSTSHHRRSRSRSPVVIRSPAYHRGSRSRSPRVIRSPSYHRRSRSSSPVVILSPSYHRRSRSRSPIVIRSASHHRRSRSHSPRVIRSPSYHRRSRSRSPIVIRPTSHHRRSRSRSPMVIRSPSYHRGSRSRSPRVIRSPNYHRRLRSSSPIVVQSTSPAPSATINTVIRREDDGRAGPMPPFITAPNFITKNSPPAAPPRKLQKCMLFRQRTGLSPPRAGPSSWVGRLANHFRSRKQDSAKKLELEGEMFQPQAQIIDRGRSSRRSWSPPNLITSKSPSRIPSDRDNQVIVINLPPGSEYRRRSRSRSLRKLFELNIRYRRSSPMPYTRYRPGYGIFRSRDRGSRSPSRWGRRRSRSPIIIQCWRNSPRRTVIVEEPRRSRSQSPFSRAVSRRTGSSVSLTSQRRSRSRIPVRRYICGSRSPSPRVMVRSPSSSLHRLSGSRTRYRGSSAESHSPHRRSRSPRHRSSRRRFHAGVSRSRSRSRSPISLAGHNSHPHNVTLSSRSVSR